MLERFFNPFFYFLRFDGFLIKLLIKDYFFYLPVSSFCLTYFSIFLPKSLKNDDWLIF